MQEQTKTSAGMRTISIPEKVVSFLRNVQKSQDPQLNHKNLVLPNSRYAICRNTNVGRRWRWVCAALDIPYQGVHALRHTWATRAFEKDINVKTVSEMLGHKNVTTTMNIYQDVLPKYQETVSEHMNDLF